MYSHPGGDRIRFRRVFYFEKKPRVLTPRLNYVFGPQIEYVQIYSRMLNIIFSFSNPSNSTSSQNMFPLHGCLLKKNLDSRSWISTFPFTAFYSKTCNYELWMVRSRIPSFLIPFSLQSFLLRQLQE
jgi:hypothetical protein